MAWKNKKFTSTFHSKKILTIIDFGGMEKAKEWQDKTEKEARQAERSSSERDLFITQ
jgi:hypothetical protein